MLSARPAAVALEGVGAALPGPPIPQRDIRAAAEEVLGVLAPELVEKMSIFETVGIDARHFVRPIPFYLEPHGWEERSRIYAEDGLALLEAATRDALAQAGRGAEDVDGIVLVSTTGIATPSLDARLLDRLPFRRDVARVPVFGLGCAGGVGGLNLAARLAQANPKGRYLLLSLELCSLAFNLNDLSVRAFVATTLFSDGAAAALVAGPDAPDAKPLARWRGGATHTWPDTERVMGWDVLDEGLRVVFSRRIPDITREKLAPVVEAFLKAQGAAPDRYVFHPGGTKVLEAYEAALGLSPDALDTARTVLRQHGNMSSPTVLFTLRESLARAPLAPGESALLAALGPGFSADLALLEG